MDSKIIMKLFIYLFISILSITGVTNAEASKSQDDVLLQYKKLQILAVKDDLNSQYEIWHFAKNNRPQLDNRLREAFSFITKAGKAGHVEAQFTIGSMYQTGTLVEKDSDVALGWLLEAANNDHRKAQHLVGSNYSSRTIGATDEKEKNENEKLAIYWFEKAITDKSLIALKHYGIFLFMIDTFSEKSKNLLEQASNMNDSSAMYWLGKMYAHRWSDNRGENEFELALIWLEKAKLNGYDSQLFIDKLNKKKQYYLESLKVSEK